MVLNAKKELCKICSVVKFTTPYDVWEHGIRNANFIKWVENEPSLLDSFVFKDRRGAEGTVCPKRDCRRWDMRLVAGVMHKCGSAHVTSNESHWPEPYSRPFNWNDSKIRGKNLCVIYTFTRDSNIQQKAEDTIRHHASHENCYKECKNYLRNLDDECYRNLKIISGRFFHKLGPSDETLVYSSRTFASSGVDMFPFDLLVSTLDDISKRVKRIVLALRHILSLGCAGHHLRNFFQNLKNKKKDLFEIIDVYVTGFDFDKNHLIDEPFIISAQDLLYYLSRYPISITENYDYENVHPVNKLFKSMLKELRTKNYPRGIGRSKTDPVEPFFRLQTDMERYLREREGQKKPKTAIHSKQYHKNFQKNLQPQNPVSWDINTDIYIVNWLQTQKDANILQWDHFIYHTAQSKESPLQNMRMTSTQISDRLSYIRKRLMIKLERNIVRNRDLTPSDIHDFHGIPKDKQKNKNKRVRRDTESV
jgi:hypothetical protein